MFRYWLSHVLVEISDTDSTREKHHKEQTVAGNKAETKAHASHEEGKNYLRM